MYPMLKLLLVGSFKTEFITQANVKLSRPAWPKYYATESLGVLWDVTGQLLSLRFTVCASRNSSPIVTRIYHLQQPHNNRV